MPTLTIFTPAYNRAHTLPRTYASLFAQKSRDFVWLIIDDGSTDGTEDLVRGWMNSDNGFEIRYIRKENGGMHTAHNTAYENIDTELNVCIDSDDALAENAVEIILSEWKRVKSTGVAGLIGLDADFSGNIIGTRFPDGVTETTLSGFYAAGGSGDKKLVYRTDIITSVPPYPVFDGEKYVALAYKYLLVDQKYKMAAINRVLCSVEYQPDGSSNSMWRQYLANPRGFAFWRKVCMTYPTSRNRLFVDCVHYCSSCVIAHIPHFISQSPKKALTAAALPFGIALAVLTRVKAQKVKK